MPKAAYGSDQVPVSLDPFRTIVEVGWDTYTHFTFPLTIRRRSVTKDYAAPVHALEEDPGGEQPVDWTIDPAGSPGTGTHDPAVHEYVTGFQYELQDGMPLAGWGLRKGAWTGGLDFDASPSGMPTFPVTHTVDSWKQIFLITQTFSTVFSWWPRAEYETPFGGSDIANIAVPDHPALGFTTALSAALRMRGKAFSSGPLPGVAGDLARPPTSATMVPADYGFFDGIVTPSTGDGFTDYFGETSFDFSAASVVRHGTNYDAIGLALVPDIASDPTTPGTLWVLCKRRSS